MAIFLAFVLLATQTLVHLYATSAVTATAFDVARRSAAEGGTGCDDAPMQVQRRLGRHATAAQITCQDDGEHLGIRIVTDSPARLFDAIGGRDGSIDRTATVRIERPR